jgi:hypothetical protein
VSKLLTVQLHGEEWYYLPDFGGQKVPPEVGISLPE